VDWFWCATQNNQMSQQEDLSVGVVFKKVAFKQASDRKALCSQACLGFHAWSDDGFLSQTFGTAVTSLMFSHAKPPAYLAATTIVTTFYMLSSWDASAR
jgi:hypothetical protein